MKIAYGGASNADPFYALEVPQPHIPAISGDTSFQYPCPVNCTNGWIFNCFNPWRFGCQ
jgi:hypothetical protein